MRTGIAIVAGVVCATSLALHVRDRDRHRQELAALRGELEGVRRVARAGVPAVQLAGVAQRSSAAAAAAPAAAGGPAPERADPADGAAVATVEERRQRTDAMIKRVETAFAAQSVDDGWAGATAKAITQAITGALPEAASMRGVDCRATLCRVDLAFNGGSSRERFEKDTLLAAATWRGAMLISHEDAESAVVYLAREGSDDVLAVH